MYGVLIKKEEKCVNGKKNLLVIYLGITFSIFYLYIEFMVDGIWEFN